MRIYIRHEKAKDYIEIRKVNNLAFGQPNEGLLVDKLRTNPDFIDKLSIVADLNNKIIGHILFFPIKIRKGKTRYVSLALAPMSVLPEYQNRGIGGRLIEKGLETAKRLGFKSVIVLGHKDYYPRFGFASTSKWDIKAPFDLPDDVFMAIELVPDGLKQVTGIVEYPKEFDEVS
jgi:putative acetyltransferase